jgi:transposase
MTYEKSFKEEAVKLSDEIGVKNAAAQLGIPYYTLSEWRCKRRNYGSQAHVGSGHKRKSADPQEQRIYELEKENAELRRSNEILQEALGFFAANRKK